jgi:hypothetical protein
MLNKINWHNKSLKGENELCKEFNLKKTPQSGAAWHSKSDAYTKKLRVEIKETDGESLRIQRKWLNKIQDEAELTGRIPVLLFRINDLYYAATPANHFFSVFKDDTND